MMVPSRCLPEPPWHQSAVSCRKTYQRWINSHHFRSQRYRSIPSPSWKNVLGRTIAVIVLLPVILETEIQICPRHWRPKHYRRIPAPALCQHPQVEKQFQVQNVSWIEIDLGKKFEIGFGTILMVLTKRTFDENNWYGFHGFDKNDSLIKIFRSSS